MEALNFNSLNPLVVKYWYFFRMTLGTWGTAATAKRFTKRWGVSSSMHPLIVDVRSWSSNQEWEHRWWGRHPPTIQHHTGASSESFAQQMNTGWLDSLATHPVLVPCCQLGLEWPLSMSTYLHCSSLSSSCFYGTQECWSGCNFYIF